MGTKDLFIMKPKVDFCFKELLNDEYVRKGFLAAILGIAPERILWTKLMPTYLRKHHKEDKFGILDVRVMLQDESQVDVEMQVIAYDYWAERSLFYLSKMYVDQIHEGEDYGQLKKCIHVSILDFKLFDDEEYYSRFHLWEDYRRLQYSDKFEIHVLELPKLEKYDYPETELLKWARFFNATDKEELEMAAEGNEYTQKAYERLVELSADEEKRMEYEARQKALRDYQHMMNSGWRQGYGKGKEAGVEAGREEGRKEGVEEGRKEGIEEGAKASIEMLQELGISREEVQTKVQEKFLASDEIVKEWMSKYWK